MAIGIIQESATEIRKLEKTLNREVSYTVLRPQELKAKTRGPRSKSSPMYGRENESS